ncbi:methyltransferase family protein [Micromonospora chersina]|uniref:methyltransferase family protein n=1 Tax=Micromonospora chersina TaxID=47854 RepID=UPI00371A8AA1
MLAPYGEHSAWARIFLDASVGAFAVGEVRQALRVRHGATRINLRAETLFRVMFVGGILLLPAGRAVTPGATIGGPWFFALGAVIVWLGLLLRWWSFVTLGKYFTLVVKTSEEQPVVDSGPYRVLRHPSYTGLLLAFAGCGVMLGNWVGTAAGVVVISIALVYRLRIEERALIAELGNRYRDYAASRARLIPHVW